MTPRGATPVNYIAAQKIRARGAAANNGAQYGSQVDRKTRPGMETAAGHKGTREHGWHDRRQPRSSIFRSLNPRATLLFVLVAGLYGLLAGRLVYLQAARHAYFQGQADAYRVSKSLLPAQRG